MTPNEIIKAMDEFAAFQAKATPGPWRATEPTGGDEWWFGDGSEITTKAPNGDALCVFSANTEEQIANFHLIAASRSIPAAEAAALIREMREMMKKMSIAQAEQGYDGCVFCDASVNNSVATHAPDCKLAQMLKD